MRIPDLLRLSSVKKTSLKGALLASCVSFDETHALLLV